MTLAKVEGVNGDVFIPDQISDEEKNFLLERTENIIGIVTRAKVEIGFELLKVENKFKERAQFRGQNGWYHEWYLSLGINRNQKTSFVNAARLTLRSETSEETINSLADDLVSRLTLPNLHRGGKAKLAGGASRELVDYAIASGSELTGRTLPPIKDTDLNQLLCLEEVVEMQKEAISVAKTNADNGPTNKENPLVRARLLERLEVTNKSLKEAERRLEEADHIRSALEAKYEDWRSPEAIKQEFDEAKERGRAEERAKKEAAVDPAIAKKLTEKDLALQEKDLEIEKVKAQLELAQKQEPWEAEDQLSRLLSKIVPANYREQSLDKQVEFARESVDALNKKVADSEDPSKVTPRNLEARVERVNMVGAQWCELAISYLSAKRVCTDESMIARAEDGIRKSWRSWVEVLPLDTLSELQEMLDQRLNHLDVNAAQTDAVVTIDV